jgi:hypothetical protein
MWSLSTECGLYPVTRLPSSHRRTEPSPSSAAVREVWIDDGEEIAARLRAEALGLADVRYEPVQFGDLSAWWSRTHNEAVRTGRAVLIRR